MSLSTAECFVLKLRSLEMVANSSSSHNLNPILEGTSTKDYEPSRTFMCSAMESIGRSFLRALSDAQPR